MRILTIYLLLTGSLILSIVKAQDSSGNTQPENELLVLPPLFEYPVAPEELDWNERSNWLVEHFWDNFDIKQKSVGQSQLIHAFRTYVVPMHFADREVAMKSMESLISKIKKNPTLLLQFTQAAERTIYAPQTAEMFVDEVYVKLLKALIDNKKIPKIRKVRYESQYKSLVKCMEGGQMPTFKYMDKGGQNSEFKSCGKPAIIEFGDYDCSECRIARLRLETDTDLQKLVDEGKVSIVFISPDVDSESADAWRNGVTDFPANWVVGMGESLEEELDLRHTPCIYLLDASGKIVSKNANADTARAFAKKAVAESQSTE